MVKKLMIIKLLFAFCFSSIWAFNDGDLDDSMRLDEMIHKKVMDARKSSPKSIANALNIPQFKGTAVCINCDFTGQDLREIFKSFENNHNITKIILDGSDLSNANISGANLSNAQMKSTILDRVNAENTNFKNANLAGSIMTRGNFENANFSNSHLYKTLFTKTNASHAKFKNAHLNNADLSHAYFNNVNFNRANLSFAKLRNTGLEYVTAKDANFKNADCSETSFSGATLNGTDFTGATFDHNTNFNGAKMRDCILQGVKTIIGLKTLLQHAWFVPKRWRN